MSAQSGIKDYKLFTVTPVLIISQRPRTETYVTFNNFMYAYFKFKRLKISIKAAISTESRCKLRHILTNLRHWP